MILFLDWYDLVRGVAQLGQVLSFLAEIIETFLPEAYVLIRGHCLVRVPLSPYLLYTLCHALVLSVSHLFEESQPVVATFPSRGLSQPVE